MQKAQHLIEATNVDYKGSHLLSWQIDKFTTFQYAHQLEIDLRQDLRSKSVMVEPTERFSRTNSKLRRKLSIKNQCSK